MRNYRYSQALLNLAFYAFVVCMTTHPSLFIANVLFPLVAFLVLVGLLMFVVGRSEDIYRVASACLQTLPIYLFPLVPDRVSINQLPAKIILPTAPSLSPRFQRPPPSFSI